MCSGEITHSIILIVGLNKDRKSGVEEERLGTDPVGVQGVVFCDQSQSERLPVFKESRLLPFIINTFQYKNSVVFV